MRAKKLLYYLNWGLFRKIRFNSRFEALRSKPAVCWKLSGFLTCVHLIIGVFISTTVSARPLQRFEFEKNLMGTKFRLLFYAPTGQKAQSSADRVFARLDHLDQVMSDYKADSELMRLSRQAGHGPIPISPDLFQVLREAQKWAQATNGAFDCTLGTLTQLWRRTRRQQELPSPERLAAALTASGHENLILDPRRRTACLLILGMRLDLGAIGKGFAASEALRLLKQLGANRALVVAGGEMAAGAPPPGKNGWKIQIAPLTSSGQEPGKYLLLKNAAVSTSGDAEQYVELQGRRYSHILDPKTGLGLPSHRSVSVIAPRGATSDALATALNVMGTEKGLKLIESMPKLAAFFVEATEAGITATESKNWKKFEAPLNSLN
jgi:FAD:protein FMN transferase